MDENQKACEGDADGGQSETMKGGLFIWLFRVILLGFDGDQATLPLDKGSSQEIEVGGPQSQVREGVVLFFCIYPGSYLDLGGGGIEKPPDGRAGLKENKQVGIAARRGCRVSKGRNEASHLIAVADSADRFL